MGERRRKRLRGARGALALLGGLLAACAGGLSSRTAYAPDELLAAVRGQVPASRVHELTVPFAVSQATLARARELVLQARSEYGRAQLLLYSITADDGFGLRYEPVATASAEVTLRRGYGNCLALTSVFIGLARGLGLTAFYIDASDRASELRREEELIVDTGHIAAVVRTERGYSLVDFDGELGEYRTFRIIDDVEALAHFYNNRGYELIHLAQRAGDPIPWEAALRSFQLAVLVRPGFARAHNNLGVVYARLGRPELAAREYRAAIEADDDFAAPHHNLGNLRLVAGDLEGALAAYEEAVQRQPRNPFLHYHRGVALYRRGDAGGAEAAFKRAISLKRDYIEPHNLLAQLYIQQGRYEEAERMRRAVQSLTSRRRSS